MTAHAPASLQSEVVRHLSAQGRMRDRVIIGAVLAAVWAVAGAELFSLFTWLSFWPLLIWWSVAVVSLVAMLIGRKLRAPQPMRHGWRLTLPRDWVLTLICAAVALILGTTFVVAVATPPNNADSLIYHLPRQVYWMLQRHVGFYPAADVRQLVMPPFAEYLGVQLMILSGGDRWLNLIQWLALGLSALTASAIARELGCNARLQALAGLFVVTIPVAALQAVNTKNDVVSGFFALAAVFFALKQYRRIRPAPGIAGPSWNLALLIGASLGLLVFTKSSGALLALPIAAWVGILLLRFCRWPRALACGLVVATAALAINAAHFARVHYEFGSPVWVPKDIQTSGEQIALPDGNPDPRHERLILRWATLTNRDRSPKAFLSNLIRNTTMHLATGSRAIDGAIKRSVSLLHQWLGIDLNDPRTTYSAGSRFEIEPLLTDENSAKAPIHVLLALLLLPLMAASIRRKSDPWILSLMFSPYLGFFLLCYSLSWQQWHPRLHIPVLFSLCPFIVCAMRTRFEKVLYPAAVVTTALTLYAVAFNFKKPILGESSIFTKSRDDIRMRPPGRRTKDFLQEIRVIHSTLKPKVVGIRAGGAEYLLQVPFLESDPPPPKLIQLKPRFVPRRASLVTQAPPDLVIGGPIDRPKKIKTGEREYWLADERSELAVYLPAHQKLPPGLSLKRPPFAGWCALESVAPEEGPYPQWDLPVVRWGLGPSSRLEFLSDGAMKQLVLNCRRNDHTNQQMTVEVNGASLTNLAFGPEFEFKEWTLPIPTVPGTNEVKIRYSNWQQAGRPVAVLYKKLAVE